MNEANGLNEVVFTSAAVLDLLLQIDELKEYTIGMSETPDSQIQIQIGNSIYLINSEDCKTIRVEDEIVGEIEVTTEEAYGQIETDIQSDADELPMYFEDEIVEYYDPDEPQDAIEGSFIKDIAKSLALGGMIRFATKHLLK